jgi:hypothetical protein
VSRTGPFRYAVDGAGEFPLDMLRYDCAYPDTSEDAVSVARSFDHRCGRSRANLPLGGRSWWRTSRQKGNRLAGALPTYLRPPPGLRPGLRGEETGKPPARGVHAGQRLSFRTGGQARALINGVQNPGQNRTREIRPSGIAGGFENRDQSRRWRAGARAQFRARQPHARFDGRGLETERCGVTSPRQPPTQLSSKRNSAFSDAPAPRAHQHQAPSQYLQPTPLGVARRTQRPDTRSPTSISAAT